jgi:hypothetical protein
MSGHICYIPFQAELQPGNEMVIQPRVLVEQTEHRTDQAQLTAAVTVRRHPTQPGRRLRALPQQQPTRQADDHQQGDGSQSKPVRLGAALLDPGVGKAQPPFRIPQARLAASTAGVLRLLRVLPLPRRRWRTLRAVAKAGGVAGRSPGALIPGVLGSRRVRNAKSGHAAAARPKRHRPRWRSAIASAWRGRPWHGLRQTMGGPSWPPPAAGRAGALRRGGQPSTTHTAQGQRALVGASPRRRAPGRARAPGAERRVRAAPRRWAAGEARLQRQVRLHWQSQQQPGPGHTGRTAPPPAAGVISLGPPVLMV